MRAASGEPVCREIKRVEAEQHGERDEDFVTFKILFALEKFARPADLHERRAECGERGEEMPAAVERDDNQTDVEDGDVAEEAEWIVLAGRKQNRRQEAPQHSEDGHDEGVEPRGEQECRGRDERHEQERGNRPEKIKMINRAASERDGIQHDDARGTKRLRERGEVFARHHHSAHEQSDAGEKTDGDAQFRWNEVVVERVFDEERDAEEQRESTDPRKTFHAHELFPVDGRLGFWRWNGCRPWRSWRRVNRRRRGGGQRRW